MKLHHLLESYDDLKEELEFFQFLSFEDSLELADIAGSSTMFDVTVKLRKVAQRMAQFYKIHSVMISEKSLERIANGAMVFLGMTYPNPSNESLADLDEKLERHGLRTDQILRFKSNSSHDAAYLYICIK